VGSQHQEKFLAHNTQEGIPSTKERGKGRKKVGGIQQNQDSGSFGGRKSKTNEVPREFSGELFCGGDHIHLGKSKSLSGTKKWEDNGGPGTAEGGGGERLYIRLANEPPAGQETGLGKKLLGQKI